jgi:hypothetical protein
MVRRTDLVEIRERVAASLPEAYAPLLLTFYGQAAREADGDIVIGDDDATELRMTDTGAVISVDPGGKLPTRFMNSGLEQLATFLHVVSGTDRSDDDAEREMWRKLLIVDPTAFADRENWWAVILEQVRDEIGWW